MSEYTLPETVTLGKSHAALVVSPPLHHPFTAKTPIVVATSADPAHAGARRGGENATRSDDRDHAYRKHLSRNSGMSPTSVAPVTGSFGDA
jgi:hypothetical protein